MSNLSFAPTVPVALASSVTGNIVVVFLHNNKPLPRAADWLDANGLLDRVLSVTDTVRVDTVREDVAEGQHLLLVNLGTATPSEEEAVAKGEAIAKALLSKLDNRSVSIIVENDADAYAAVAALGYGLVTGQYNYSLKTAERVPSGKFYLVSEVAAKSPIARVNLKHALTNAVAANLQRTLIDTPPNKLGVEGLVQAARDVAAELNKPFGDALEDHLVEISVLRGSALAKFGLLNAVARASGRTQQPAVVVLTYTGNTESDARTVLVGKGLVYDTGGVNLKSDGGRGMKADMGGAAVALSTFYAVAERQLNTNLTVVLGIVRNDIGPDAYAPDDVYTAYNGKTVEIDNTDAEGRLVLADCLAYAEANLNPTQLISVATLTGAKLVALGEEYVAALSLNQPLADAFIDAANDTFELAWQLPLSHKVHKRIVNSPVADLVNSSRVSRAGTSGAAYFLTCFVDKVPYLHLDVAGTVSVGKPAWGIRALCRLLEAND